MHYSFGYNVYLNRKFVKDWTGYTDRRVVGVDDYLMFASKCEEFHYCIQNNYYWSVGCSKSIKTAY